MSEADERLRRILSGLDAPAEDQAFVATVMALAAARPARVRPLPAAIRPFGWIAWLTALGAVAPLLVEGTEAALAASDPQVLSGSLAMAAAAWFMLDGVRRSRRPALAI